MPRVCPRCQNSFNDRIICPTCNVRLLPAGSALYEVGGSGLSSPEGRWQQTTVGRAVVGLMLAQGLYYGLWQLFSAFFLAVGSNAIIGDWSRSPPEGWVWWAIQGIQAISVLFGGIMAGVGQRWGSLLGLGVGLINSLIFLSVQTVVRSELASSPALATEELFIPTVLQMACGAIGGLIGCMVWRPIIPIVGPTGTTPTPGTHLTSLNLSRRVFRSFRGPVSWVRVGVGIALAVTLSMWSDWLLGFLLRGQEGVKMSVPTQLHAKFVTWEFSVLALIVGAAIGGSNTRYGLKHGLLVGLGAFGVLALFYNQEILIEVPQAILYRYFLHIDLKNSQLGLSEKGEMIVLSFFSVLPLGMLGGWFGGQLLPPLVRMPRQKRSYATGP